MQSAIHFWEKYLISLEKKQYLDYYDKNKRHYQHLLCRDWQIFYNQCQDEEKHGFHCNEKRVYSLPCKGFFLSEEDPVDEAARHSFHQEIGKHEDEEGCQQDVGRLGKEVVAGFVLRIDKDVYCSGERQEAYGQQTR